MRKESLFMQVILMGCQVIDKNNNYIKNTKTNRYKLIGNAVTVNIVEFIARKLILNLKVK